MNVAIPKALIASSIAPIAGSSSFAVLLGSECATPATGNDPEVVGTGRLFVNCWFVRKSSFDRAFSSFGTVADVIANRSLSLLGDLLGNEIGADGTGEGAGLGFGVARFSIREPVAPVTRRVTPIEPRRIRVARLEYDVGASSCAGGTAALCCSGPSCML